MKSSNFIYFFVFLFLGIALFFNLDNLAIPRQGTEGFYLKILKEMSSENSFLTPLYLGQPHWSKPPLHFWFALPIIEIFGTSAIFAGRLSVLVLTFIFIFLITWKVTRISYISRAVLFLCLIFNFGTIKFFRIYMMESLLSLTITLSLVSYFYFLKTQKKLDLLFTSVVASLSCLVKGPVSLAIIFGGISAFHIAEFVFLKKQIKQHQILSFISMVFLCICFSFPWFIQQYFEYGQQFIDYFFLRENFGKFVTKTYSPFVIVQGLFIYSIPWIFYFSPQKLKDRFKNLDRFDYFLISCFFVAFFIWFIPSQRSHHYAMPSLYLWLIFWIKKLHEINYFLEWKGLIKNLFFYFNCFLFLLLCLVILFIKGTTNAVVFLGIILLCLFIYHWDRSFLNRSLIGFSVFTMTWYALIPELALPFASNKALDEIFEHPDRQVFVIHRKPLFIEEGIGRKVLVLSENEISKVNVSDYLFCPSSIATPADYALIDKWPTWKRGIRLSEALSALSTGNYENLYQYYSLYQRQ